MGWQLFSPTPEIEVNIAGDQFRFARRDYPNELSSTWHETRNQIHQTKRSQ